MRLLLALAVFASSWPLHAADQPQFGQAWSRNMVSAEKGLPSEFDPAKGNHLKWTAALGTESHSTPVVSGGRIFIGTNNGEPRDERRQGDRGVLMCFDERDGKLQWQLVVPKREADPYFDWPKSGISSPATVEGHRVYLVDNRGVVLCLDARGLANGNDGPFRDEATYFTPRGTNGAPEGPVVELGPLDADILWKFDLTQEAGIWSHDAAHSSILIHGDHLYLNTGTGVDNTHKKIRTPDAPSLVVLDKNTGQWLATDGLGIAPKIFHCTWSSPSLATVDGRELVFFAGGDGVLYAFEPLPAGFRRANSASSPEKLRLAWRWDFDPTAPKEDIHRYNGNRAISPSNIYGCPVFHDGRLYVAGGGDWFWGKNEAWLKCIDPRGQGELSPTNRIWEFPVGRHTISTPAVQDGLVFVADSMRQLHCVDAVTGREMWNQELGGEVWASALIADGKVYVGTRRGDFWVFALGREKKILSQAQLDGPISATPVAANGVLYVATQTRLHAFANSAGRP
ncbi:MAG TPA: PQQ-binding-like beta-propeller repeat protein [Verrucomicrobiota bacterium]|nr:PQQ-binding-like beta-propeller repeat protein [Verrucomicrobiota bacterium]